MLAKVDKTSWTSVSRSAITDEKREWALLVYYTGKEGWYFGNLVDTGDNFAMAKEKLMECLDPKKNVKYQIYTFW